MKKTRFQNLLSFLLLLSLASGGIFPFQEALGADKPPKTTSDLADALKDGKKTINFSGTERDDVKIRKGVRVIGSSPEKAVINGDIVMADGSSLENVTINGKVIPVTVEKGASATLTNVSVRGGSDAGIYAPTGGGTLTVKNSRIFKNRKGFYVLRGKNVILSGNQITENKEEGADFHSAISGTISGNTFSGNGEGGMEMIINGSTVTISGNTFSGNHSSGLALQTYSGKESLGKLSIQKNTFSGNGNYGIDCKNPQGSGSNSYFLSSATAIGNVLAGNKLGPISPRCRFANQAEIPKEDIAEQAVETEEFLETEEEEQQEEAVVEEAFQEVQARIEEPEAVIPENTPPAPEQKALLERQLSSVRNIRWDALKDSFLAKSPISFLPFSAWRETIGGFLSGVRW